MSGLIDKILKEAVSTDLQQAVSDFKSLASKYQAMGCIVEIEFRQEQSVHLSRIEVPEGRRQEGIGSEFMSEFASLGDRYGLILTLSSADDYGSNMNRLIKFYKRFGFRLNNGSKADHRFWVGMIRDPK